MSKAKLYCGGCGKANVGAFETCTKCGWHAPTTSDLVDKAMKNMNGVWGNLGEAMQRTADYEAACMLDPSLRPPNKTPVDWRSIAELLVAAIRFKVDFPGEDTLIVFDAATAAFEAAAEREENNARNA